MKSKHRPHRPQTKPGLNPIGYAVRTKDGRLYGYDDTNEGEINGIDMLIIGKTENDASRIAVGGEVKRGYSIVPLFTWEQNPQRIAEIASTEFARRTGIDADGDPPLYKTDAAFLDDVLRGVLNDVHDLQAIIDAKATVERLNRAATNPMPDSGLAAIAVAVPAKLRDSRSEEAKQSADQNGVDFDVSAAIEKKLNLMAASANAMRALILAAYPNFREPTPAQLQETAVG